MESYLDNKKKKVVFMLCPSNVSIGILSINTFLTPRNNTLYIPYIHILHKTTDIGKDNGTTEIKQSKTNLSPFKFSF